MLNIMHLVNKANLWGPGRFILSSAAKLHNEYCKIYLGYSTQGPMLDKAAELGIRAVNIPMSHPFDIRAAIDLRNICRELSIDVIHTHFMRENYISALSKILGNRVILINTKHTLSEKNIFINAANLFFSLFDDSVVAVSEAVEKSLRREVINSSKICVIRNGVDPASWKGRRSLKLRDELGIDRKAFVITSLSRFSEEKGHLFLMEAIKRFNKLRLSSPDNGDRPCVFLLAGEGEMYRECMEFARMLGVEKSIVFAGYRENVRELLYTSDLYISHSKREGLGLAILEALACGLPVLATDSGGTSEIINESNKCGKLVDAGETEEFAAALLKFVDDKEYYKACKKAAGEAIGEKFCLDTAVRETYNLYMRSLTAGNC